MSSLESIATYGAIGAVIGSGLYLYKKGYFKDLIGGGGNGDGTTPPPAPCPVIAQCAEGSKWSDLECKCVSTTPTTPPPIQYAYYAKRKYQCRDAHLTFAFLASQGVRVLNYKVHNDGLIYPAVCNSPGPLLILVAIAIGDVQSGSILQSLGFVEYQAPPTQPNPDVPLPSPPNPLPSSNYAMAYAGSTEGHRAYKSWLL